MDPLLMTVLAGAGFGVTLLTLDRATRGFRSTKVTCWFCSHATQVPFASRNSWYCPEVSCGQYNGFTSDGDYNWEDPAKYDDVGPNRDPDLPGERKGCPPNTDNGLCRTCNLNQSLKMFQLAKFEPKVEANYDQEVEAFATHLERTYRLCRTCEATLHQTLGEQDSWIKPKLLSWRLEANRIKTVETENIYKSSRNRLSRRKKGIFALMMALLGLLVSLAKPLCQPSSDVVAPNATLLTAWAVKAQGIFLSIPELVLPSYAMALLAILFFTLPQSPSNSPSTFLPNVMSMLTFTSWNLVALPSGAKLLNYDDLIPVLSEALHPWTGQAICLCFTLVLFVYQSLQYPRPLRKPSAPAKPYKPNLSTFNQAQTFNDHEETLTQDLVSSKNSSPESHHSFGGSRVNQGLLRPSQLHSKLGSSFALEENDEIILRGDSRQNANRKCDISSLSIDGSSDMNGSHEAKEGGTFTLRSYSPLNQSGINFGGAGGNSNVINHCQTSPLKPLIQPPRFKPKNVARASWVAGGYWQHGQAPNPTGSPRATRGLVRENFSRASSQSSGFISHGGVWPQMGGVSLPNSRTNSLCGDAERQSLLSEPLHKILPNETFASGRELNLSRRSACSRQTLARGGPSQMNSLILPRTNSQASQYSDDSDLDQLTLSVFEAGRPTANSSPVPSKVTASGLHQRSEKSRWQKQITINISLYSVLFVASVIVNACVLLYFLMQALA